MQETAFSKTNQIKNNFTSSYWLKARIQEIKDRDIVDMYHDTLALKELLRNHSRTGQRAPFGPRHLVGIHIEEPA